jgi:hypothetical protein
MFFIGPSFSILEKMRTNARIYQTHGAASSLLDDFLGVPPVPTWRAKPAGRRSGTPDVLRAYSGLFAVGVLQLRVVRSPEPVPVLA